MATPAKAAVGIAPAKLILAGEHAVVHGAPAVALAFPALAARVTATPSPGPLTLESPLYCGPLAEAPDACTGLAEAARATCSKLGVEAKGLALAIESDVPMGSGLGSSAAVAVALVRAIAASHGAPLDTPTLLALAHTAETHVHGRPSGIDTHAVALGVPIRFVRGEGARPLAVAAPVHLVVGDTGAHGDTRSAVAAVAEQLAASPAETRARLDRLGAIAEAVATAMESGDLARLGGQLDAAHEDLAALGVSDGRLDALVAAARGAGALGAKLTGGGRGGCMLALVTGPEAASAVEAALTRAGAAHVWHYTQHAVERTLV